MEKKRKSQTERLLNRDTNPLVTISIVQHTDLVLAMLTGAHVGRSMGFMVERLAGNLRLVATCRHGLLGRRSFEGLFIVGIENPLPTVVECVGCPLEDPDVRYDVAFLVVRDPQNANSRPFTLSANDPPRIRRPQTLYSAQNTCNPLQQQYGTTIAKNAAGVETTRAYRSMLHGDDTRWFSFEDADACARMVDEGWIEHRRLNILSRNGFSGSPIWDQELNLYGMVVAGSDPDDPRYKEIGDYCICLPTSQLFLARQRIEPQLQELLASVG